MWDTGICKVEILNRILQNLAFFYKGMKMSQYMTTKYSMDYARFLSRKAYTLRIRNTNLPTKWKCETKTLLLFSQVRIFLEGI